MLRSMTMAIVVTTFCIALPACSLRAQEKKDDGKKVLDKIQGTWKFAIWEQDGKDGLPKDQVQTITFKGDIFTLKRGDMVFQAGTNQFDPSKKPGTVDAKMTEGEGKGNTMLGIYEFVNDDTLKVCFDPVGKKRPTEFKAGVGSGLLLAVVKREKK